MVPPSISVVIPTYNAAPTLQRTLDCLLKQRTDTPYEIIVSDDGSTDNTPQIRQLYSQKEVCYIRHANVGRAQNRNIGVRRARGKYLVFLDADMMPSPGFVSAYSQVFGQAGERCVISGAVPVAKECEVYPVGRFLAHKWRRRLAALQSEPDNIFHMQSGNFGIEKEFFENLGGFDAHCKGYGGEDTDLFARAYLAGAHFLYLPEAFAYQLVDLNFAALLEKASSASRASDALLQRYPSLAIYAAVNKPAKLNLKGRIWHLFRQMPFSFWVLLKLLPIAEHLCSDRVVFTLYNSLLSEYRQRAKP